MESTRRTKDQDVSNQGGTANSPANQKEHNPSVGGEQKDKQFGNTEQNKQSYSSTIANAASNVLPSNETINQAKQTVTDAYNRASHGVSDTYNQAIDYGRHNPGTMTLIAFGAGIGVGLLLSNSFSSNNRTDRIMPPVMNALSAIATEIFRR